MNKIKLTKQKTLIETHTYHLTDEIKYVKEFVNGKLKEKELRYTGKNLNKYSLLPLYNFDLEILKKWNPFWGKDQINGYDGYKALEQKDLPEPEEMDITKLIYCQSSTHEFYDINKEPIPVVEHGNYIEAGLHNVNYNLTRLRQHLLNHPNVVHCSEILDIPYYNCSGGRSQYLDVLILPTKEVLMKQDKENHYDNIFYKPYVKNSDFLKIKQFWIPEKDRPSYEENDEENDEDY